MIEITEDEAFLLDGELYKLQMQLTRQRWSVDELPSKEDIKRQEIVNELRLKINRAFKKIAIDGIVSGG
jgi:hypothetical protein